MPAIPKQCLPTPEDLASLSQDDTKTLMLEYSCAGYSVNDISEKLGLTRVHLYNLLSEDSDFALRFKYGKHLVDAAMAEFIKVSDDEQKTGLLKDLCNYLPWSLVVGCGDIINEFIDRLHDNLSTPDQINVLELIQQGMVHYHETLKGEHTHD
jgi:hypothetical protein